MSIEEDARSGRPKEAVSDENIKKVHKIILNDRKVKLIEQEFFEAKVTCSHRNQSILKNKSNLPCRWGGDRTHAVKDRTFRKIFLNNQFEQI
jgi:hypothetical protein